MRAARCPSWRKLSCGRRCSSPCPALTTVDKTEAMLGSYGPQAQAYEKIVRCLIPSSTHTPNIAGMPPHSPTRPPSWRARTSRPDTSSPQFASEESPSGMLARSGSYVVRSRVIDDDAHVWLDFEWGELALTTDH